MVIQVRTTDDVCSESIKDFKFKMSLTEYRPAEDSASAASVGAGATTATTKDNLGQPRRHFNTRFHHFRYLVILMAGLVMGTMLLFRFAINVAIVSMVNKTAIYLREHPNGTLDDYFAPNYVEGGEFLWTNEIQQLILTGYMVAYALPQFYTTRMSIKHGLRLSLPISLATCALSSILTPYLSYWGWEWVLALRLLNGVGASAILPSIMSLIEIWMPPDELVAGLALFQFVNCFVNGLIPLISGILTSYHWQWAFYMPGAFGLAICLVWYIVVPDGPAQSKFISQREMEHICGSNHEKIMASGEMGATAADDKEELRKAQLRAELPWYFVFKIKSFYFLTLALILLDSTINGFLFILPTYIDRILNVPVESIGLMNFTVQIGTMFCMLWPDPVGKFLQNQFKLSLTSARTIITSACGTMVVATFVYLALHHDNLIVVITINRFFHSTNEIIIFATIMSQFSHEKLTGLVYSVMNAIGNLSVLFFCWSVGRILDYAGESLQSWSWILAALGGLNVLYLVNYALFCPSRPTHVKLPEGPTATTTTRAPQKVPPQETQQARTGNANANANQSESNSINNA